MLSPAASFSHHFDVPVLREAPGPSAASPALSPAASFSHYFDVPVLREASGPSAASPTGQTAPISAAPPVLMSEGVPSIDPPKPSAEGPATPSSSAVCPVRVLLPLVSGTHGGRRDGFLTSPES